VYLILIGEGGLKSSVEKQARKLGLKSHVIFTGYRTDVPGILADLDLFVMSSHLEGLCTSIMDAMASGLPVVATTAGGIPEVIENGVDGLLVPTKDPDTLADAMVYILGNNDVSGVFRAKAKENVHRKFSLDRMVEGTIGVYGKLLRLNGLESEKVAG